MLIDTGGPGAPASISALVAGDGQVSLTNYNAAEKLSRRLVGLIYACDSREDLDAYEAAESLILDALWMQQPQLFASVQDALDTQRACLPSARKGDPQPAVPANQAPTKGAIMFDIDTGSSGAEGPWLAWTVQGTGDVPARSFYIREAVGKTVFDGFKGNGVVMDVAGLKTGWQHSEGVAGVAPKWAWNRSTSRFEPSPGDEWKKGFSVRCAIGGGATATWEQAGSGAWNALVGLIPQLQGGPGGDMLPLVKQTGVQTQKFAKGSTAYPTLEVVKWVPRPDCLKAEAIATEPEPAPKAKAPEKAAEYLGDDIPY